LDILQDNLALSNLLTEEDPSLRKQELLKSNIFHLEETGTKVPKKFVTGHNKVEEDKIFNVEKKPIHNKRKELDTHFSIGDNVDFQQ